MKGILNTAAKIADSIGLPDWLFITLTIVLFLVGLVGYLVFKEMRAEAERERLAAETKTQPPIE